MEERISHQDVISDWKGEVAVTGGEPLFTLWVCGGFIVGSETKYPAWTHWVHFDYFYNLPTHLSSMSPLGIWWVFSKRTQ